MMMAYSLRGGLLVLTPSQMNNSHELTSSWGVLLS